MISIEFKVLPVLKYKEKKEIIIKKFDAEIEKSLIVLLD
jgi:hypothetical protein